MQRKMASESDRSRLACWLVAAGMLAMGGCAEPFDGSIVTFTIGAGALLPGTNGEPGQPPPGTHFEMYVVKDGQAFKIFHDFEIVPQLDFSDPCQVDSPVYEETRYPGIHLSQYANRVRQDVIDGLSGDEEPTEAQLSAIATAEERLRVASLRAQGLKAIVSHDAGLTPETLAAFRATVPAATAFDDATNAERLATCEAFFAQYPGYYIGWDIILQMQTNGTWYGLVDGADPKSGSAVGGAQHRDPTKLTEFDSFHINWQFNDPGDPAAAAYEPSPIGYHYMSGTPFVRLNGIVNVSLVNDINPAINGQVAVATDLAQEPEL